MRIPWAISFVWIVVSFGYSQMETFECHISNPVVNQVPDQNFRVLSTAASNFTIADNFSITESVRINQICWYGVYDEGGSLTGSENFSIIYYDDNLGHPGNVIYNFPSVSLTDRGLTGNMISGDPEYGYAASHADVILTPGTYWLSIINETSDADDDSWSWASSADGDGMINNLENFSDIWVIVNIGDLASTLGAEIPVPTFSQWGLIILGLALAVVGSVAFRSRKMTKKSFA